MRRLGRAVLLLVVSLLFASIFVGRLAAAGLSGGNTTYIIEGEDASFTFDPISRKDGTLLPVELFQALGLEVNRDGKVVLISRGGITHADLTLGRTLAAVDGKPIILAPAPVSVVGRLFLPAAVLAELGYEVETDSGFVQVRDLAAGLAIPGDLTIEEYRLLEGRHSLTGTVRTDDGRPFLDLRVTYLTPEMVASPHLELSFRRRVEWLNLMQTSSLLLARVNNQSTRAATLSPQSLMLVDRFTQIQYDTLETQPYQGLINQKIAVGASKSSLLIYPLLPHDLQEVQVFADTNGTLFGVLTLK